MAHYYEMLGLKPDASKAEIEAAIQEKYDQWRRLVTHHDVGLVNQANLWLAELEKIRATLTDPAKRREYDASLGLGDRIGGLAVPELSVPPLTPPIVGPNELVPPQIPPPVRSEARSSLWTCYNCGADNPPHTRHCFKCGTELVRQCPECGNMTSLVATKMCGSCGYNYEVALKRRDLQDRIREALNKIKGYESQLHAAKAQTVDGCGRNLLIVFGVVGIFWGMLGSSSSFWGWLIGITCLGILVLWYRGVDAQKNAKIRHFSQLIEEQRQEIFACQQEFQRLITYKTGEGGPHA